MNKPSEIINKSLAQEIDPVFKRRAKFILESTVETQPRNILEVGCGRGFYLAILAKLLPKANIVGLDNNSDYLHQAKETLGNAAVVEKVELIEGDARNFPFEDECFDAVIASELLEHVPEDEKVIAEIYRTLSPNGLLLVTVPHSNYPFLWDPFNWVLEKSLNTHVLKDIWWLAGIWADHERLYSEAELTDKLNSRGFKITQVKHSTYYSLPFAHFLLYAVGKNIVEVGVGEHFNRFRFPKKPSYLNRLVQLPFQAFDRLNRENMDRQSYVNILLRAHK